MFAFHSRRGAMTERPGAIALALLSGVLCGFAWLPFGLEWAHPLALLPLFVALARSKSAMRSAWIGAAFLGARFAVMAHFFYALLRYSSLGAVLWLLLVLIAAAYGALVFGLVHLLETRWRIPRAIGLVLIYPLSEWIRSVGQLGFPADDIAHAFGGFPAWLSMTVLFGPHGLTLLAFACGALLAHAARGWREARQRSIVLASCALALWVIPPSIGALLSDPPVARTLRVGIVQPAVTVRDKRDPAMRRETWTRLERLTRRAARGADLVLWPETARPEPLVWDESTTITDPRMQELAREVGVPILYGTEIAALESGELRALYNGAALATPDGGPLAWYGKQRLVPFVEGVPFADWFGRAPGRRAARKGGVSYLTMMGHFSPGPELTIFDVDGVKLGVLICFEGMFPDLARRERFAGADALVVLTNDAWWGQSVFARWHARMATTRARETNVPVIRAANSGVSSATTVSGRMIDQSELGPATTLVVDVPIPDEEPSLFLHAQAWFPVLPLTALVVLALRARRRPRSGAQSDTSKLRLISVALSLR